MKAHWYSILCVRLLVAASLALSSCGLHDEGQVVGAAVQLDPQSWADTRSKIQLFGVQCCGLSEDWVDRTSVWTRPEAAVRKACSRGTEIGAACTELLSGSNARYARILISDTEPARDWALTHEYLHVISFMGYGDPDSGHIRFCCHFYEETVQKILGIQ